ncbi:transporter [Chryseobacterium oryzae]|uniref:Transporter n=1 Tax=Chryseobacterium oryzae TaxID=2929799 RepID=A0ABY4BF27_9FLAO|nr:transporter [Chryseobacterium oryzae]UOE37364.1 transporter [Chryseobacterium oryzae]
MKMIKQSILAAGILTAELLSAQDVSMNNMIKVGATAGLAVPADNLSAAIGVDVAYQNLITPGFGLGIATGYTHYFGKDNNGYKNNDVGVVPVAALFRVYPKKTGFYFGADLGYGFLLGDDKVASNSDVSRPNGGFYLKPEVGYHNRDWNFFLQYQKVFAGSNGDIVSPASQDYNVGSIGAGFSYNIPLGK